jgi:CheY-like chemotaxis protein
MLYATKLVMYADKVIQAYDGVEGIAKAKEQIPDIVLLDLMMPRMDGETFARKFRQIPGCEEVPIVILTNISRNEAPKTIWHYGISAYFVKAHHTPSDLVEKIETIITEK